MKEVIAFVVVLIVGIVVGVLFAKPTQNELAALQLLAEGKANEAFAIFHKVESIL